MEEMISANDLYYLPRLENLRKEYEACVEKIKELDETWDEYLEFENFTIFELNMISSQRQTAHALMEALEKEMDRIKFETLN